MDARRAKGILRLAIFGAVVVGLFFVIRGSKYGIIFGHPAAFDHYVQTTVPQAFEVMPGERVVSGGITEGQITQAYVTKTGQAHIVMGIKNNVWPLPTDTQFALRETGTIKYTDRDVVIYKGHASADFADFGRIPASQFEVPVEYGQFFNIFDAKTRTSLQNLFSEAGPTLRNAAEPFQKTLPSAAGPFDQGAAIFKDLGYSQQALSTLVSAGAGISKAVATSNPGLQSLIQGAAGTFTATSQEASAITQLLNVGHTANIGIGDILFGASHTLAYASTLAHKLNPGLTKLGETAQPLNGVLRELTSIEPAAVHTLDTVQVSAPSIDTLLSTAKSDLLPQLQSIASQGATELNCIRPYTPEIMNLLDSGFGAFENQLSSPKVTAFHGLVSLFPVPGGTPLSTAQLTKLLPNLRVGDHPPGESWNQPWYQPDCGITPSAMQSQNDPENGTFDPGGSKLIPFATTTPNFGPVPARNVPVRTSP